MECAGKGAVTLIDDEDSPLLKHGWGLSTNGYALRTVDAQLMHRLVLHALARETVDHINGDKLDNRRSNLRIVTPQQNSRNIAVARPDGPSGLAGVIWNAQRSKWQASIRTGAGLKHLGLYEDLAAAKVARAAAEVELWGVQPRRREALEGILGRTLGQPESNASIEEPV
jgi:hypothetical protein